MSNSTGFWINHGACFESFGSFVFYPIVIGDEDEPISGDVGRRLWYFRSFVHIWKGNKSPSQSFQVENSELTI